MERGTPWLRSFLAVGLLNFLLAAILFGLYQHRKTEAFQQLAARQQGLAEQTALLFTRHLQQVAAGLRQLAADAPQLLRSGPAAVAELKVLYHALPHPAPLALVILDDRGHLFAEYPPGGLNAAEIPADLAWPAGHRQEMDWLETRNGRLLILRQSAKGGEQVVALLPITPLLEACLRPLGREAEFGFLLDGSGTFLLHRRPDLAGRSFGETVSPTLNPGLCQTLTDFTRGLFRPADRQWEKRICYPADLLAPAPRDQHPTLLTGAAIEAGNVRWVLGLVLPPSLLAPHRQGKVIFPLILSALLALSLFASFLVARLRQYPGRLAAAETAGREETARLREALRLTERRYQDLLNNAGDAIFFIDPATGALLEVNRRAEELLGYRAEEIRHLSLAVLFPGVNHRHYLRLVARVLRRGYGEEGNLEFRCKDGRLFTGAVHARLGQLGEQQLVHGVFRDITEVKRIEQELRQKNCDLVLMNEIADHAAASRDLREMLYPILNKVVRGFGVDGGGIFLYGEDGRHLRLTTHQGIGPDLRQQIEVLETGEGLIGRVAASGQSKASADLGKDQRVASAAVRQAGWGGFQAVPLMASDRPVGVLFLFGQSKRILSRSEVGLLEAIGKQVGTAVAGANLFAALQRQVRLTEASNRELEQSRRQLRESLANMEEANRALAQIDRMKSNFLALASHELRTPLTYILSGTELLGVQLRDQLGESEVRLLDAVHQGGKRLQAIVEDLLEVARIESRSVYLAREAVDLPKVLEEIALQFAPVLADRQLSFRIASFPPDANLYGDSFHLRRTFQRLLENAIKFTPEGGEIEVRGLLRTAADLQRQEPTLRPFSPVFFATPPVTRHLQVSICDSGVGIDPEDHVRIFEKFYEIGDITGHSTSSTRFGGKGVGLGLTLVKGMIEAHGGMVWVESAGAGKGTGSAFHILLPLAADTPGRKVLANATC